MGYEGSVIDRHGDVKGGCGEEMVFGDGVDKLLKGLIYGAPFIDC